MHTAYRSRYIHVRTVIGHEYILPAPVMGCFINFFMQNSNTGIPNYSPNMAGPVYKITSFNAKKREYNYKRQNQKHDNDKTYHCINTIYNLNKSSHAFHIIYK